MTLIRFFRNVGVAGAGDSGGDVMSEWARGSDGRVGRPKVSTHAHDAGKDCVGAGKES